jgi:hypothetical protein
MVFLTIEQENAAANGAFDVLKRRPEWVLVQERLASANRKRLQVQDAPVALQQRRRAALKHLTFQGVTYLRLVSDAETADAFCNLLPLMVREAYVYSCGQVPQVVTPVSKDAQDFGRAVELRFRRLMARAYRCAQRQVQVDIQNRSDYLSSPRNLTGGTVQITPEPPEKQERPKGGRPKALLIIDGAVARTIRGDLKQSGFGAVWGLSVDVIQTAENQGQATDVTIKKLCRAAKANSLKIRREDLIKIMPQKPQK